MRSRRTRALALFVAAAALAISLRPALRATSTAAPELFAIKNARIVTVSGDEIPNGTIVVRDGKIESVGTAAPPASIRSIDAQGRVVIPGLVAAHSLVSGSPADEETIAPDLRALDGLDVYAKNRALIEGGVTTMYVSPGSDRLVSGVGAVTKTAGKDRVLRELAALQVAFGEAPKGPPPIFEPPIPPSADNPIVPARPQLPTVRAATPSTLRFAFADAAQLRTEIGRGGARRDLRLEGLFPALTREMPVRANVHREGDVLAALDLARELNLRLVIEGGTESDRLAPLLAAAKVPVVLETASRAGRLLDGDPAVIGKTGRERETAAATLAREGVLFALVPSEGGELGDLLLTAGLSCRYGLDPKTALRAVTLSAAEILGVADRVGSIEPGKDADLVILTSQEGPFDLSAAPYRVFVSGETVFERKPEAGVLAVRAGRILLGNGEEIRDGVVLVEAGRIVDVSPFASIPFDAEVIDARDGVVAPGFIDVASPLGLHAESDGGRIDAPDSGPSSGKTEVALAIDPNDPVFTSALREGVTTVIVMPAGRAMVAGQAAAVKTGGGSDAVFRTPAALRFSATASVLGAPASTWTTKLRETLKRGKDYHDRWEKYAKDLAEFETKKKETDAKSAEDAKKAAEKPVEEAKTAEAKPADEPARRESAPVDPITGHWEGMIGGGPIPEPVPFSADLKHEGGVVTGTLQSAMQGTLPIGTGSFDGTTLKLGITTPMGSLDITATLEQKDKLSGTWSIAGQASGTLECTRTSTPQAAPVTAAAPAPKKSEDGRPTEPKKDAELEPFRALFRKEIPACVDATTPSEIEAALAVFKDEFALDVVILRGDEAWRIAPDVQRRGAGVAVGPEVVQRLPEKDVNLPRLLVRAGIPIAFASLSARGAAELPLTATYAVRHGLSSTEALKGLTSGAAHLMKLDSRIGTIAAGRDADLVILTGEPFEPPTRVRAVIVGGRVAFDVEGSDPW